MENSVRKKIRLRKTADLTKKMNPRDGVLKQAYEKGSGTSRVVPDRHPCYFKSIILFVAVPAGPLMRAK